MHDCIWICGTVPGCVCLCLPVIPVLDCVRLPLLMSTSVRQYAFSILYSSSILMINTVKLLLSYVLFRSDF